MGKILEKYILYIIDDLEEKAKKILQECVDERTYTHRTKNLYDSYGYGIYCKGSLKRSGYLSSTPQATIAKKWHGERIKGREAIKQYLQSGYMPKGVIDLAVVAAMPYAKELEEGSGGLKRSYRVISMSFQKLQAIASNYSATVSVIK